MESSKSLKPGSIKRLLNDLPEILTCFVLIYVSVAAWILIGRHFALNGALFYIARITTGILIFYFFGNWLFVRHNLKQFIDESYISPWPPSKRVVVQVLVSAAVGLLLALLFKEIFTFAKLGLSAGFIQASIAMDELFPFLIVIWFVHAIGEETFFRKFLHNYLTAFFGKPLGLIVGNLVFTLAHLPLTWAEFSMYLAASIMFTFCYVRFKGLIYPVTAHAVLNISVQTIIHLKMHS